MNEELTSTLRDRVFNDLGLQLPAILLFNKSKPTVLDWVTLNPRHFGPIGCIFTSAQVQISFQYFPSRDAITLVYKFQWQHSDGSNGYTKIIEL